MVSRKKIGFILLLLLIVVLTISYYQLSINRPNYRSVGTKAITIALGMGVSDIAKLLYDNGVINSSSLLVLYVKLNNLSLEAGTYQIPSDLSIVQVVELLKQGRNDIKLTFYEGLRSEEIAEIAVTKLASFKSDEFTRYVNENSLEGKLFPDTYFFDKDSDAKSVARTLNNTFKEKTKELFNNNRTGLSENEVLILSSIVEREEADAKERPIVAGILITRYKNDEGLGADATVQYMFGQKGNWWPKSLTQGQLESENSYNTRKAKGLPPTPICNPSLGAVSAVLDYKVTDYKYYLHDAKGNIHYAKTLEEHEKNRKIYIGN